MKVKELLSDESKWCKFTYARSRGGHPVLPLAKSAVSWCLLGAIDKCYEGEAGARRRAIDKAEMWTGPLHGGVFAWQDVPGRTFAEVKAMVEELDI